MVVTSSRKAAVRYKLAFDKYIAEKGYSDVAALVAFSREVSDMESAIEKVSETSTLMNPGLKGRDIRDAFATNELVANKFQTGFDQPLLVAMYVDKKLFGVAAVQTLSRLNRTALDKDQTFVLDFANTATTGAQGYGCPSSHPCRTRAWYVPGDEPSGDSSAFWSLVSLVGASLVAAEHAVEVARRVIFQATGSLPDEDTKPSSR
jgi:hypothetical protein